MAQTMSQRPPAIRELSCPSTSAASSSRPLPARAQSDLLPETNSQRANPRRSIIGRILRASGNDNVEELNDGNGAEDTERKRKPTPSGKWEKRASRKAPTPPSRVMPGIERRHPRERSSPRIDENGFERVRENVDIPKVFLFPPEEDEIQPIKLYPLPGSLVRPPLGQLPSANGRPSSVYSVDQSSLGKTWGGMSKGFGQAAPVFRRGGRDAMAAGGVILPKKREQVTEERERRMSMYSPEEIDWQAANGGIAGPSSNPHTARATPPDIRRPISPPVELPLTPAEVPRRMDSTKALNSVGSPPLIMITSDSFSSAKTDTAHSFHSSDSGMFFPTRHALGNAEFVESPISISPPPMPLPVSTLDDAPERFDQNRGSFEILEDLEDIDDEDQDRPDSRASSDDSRPSAPQPAAVRMYTTPLASGPSSPQSGNSHRRSMSLTSIDALSTGGPPSVKSTAVEGKTIRKHKSLKKFFFSSDNLARDEQEPMPKLDKNSRLDVEKDTEKKKDTGRRGSTFGMLSRPKSKPSLRIDVKATKEVTPSAMRSAPITSSKPMVSPAPVMESAVAESSTAAPGVAKTSRSKSQPQPEPVAKGMTKRFSLSNMSAAFKRSAKKEAGPAPMVPDIPSSFKRGKAESAQLQASRVVKESAVPLSPTTRQATSSSPGALSEPLLSPRGSPRHMTETMTAEQRASSSRTNSQVVAERASTHGSARDTSSVVSELSSTFELDAELDHAQLMLVSPRTRRNPAETLQDIMGVGPIERQGAIVKHNPILSRRSVEAIVLGPLLLGPGMVALNEDADETPNNSLEVVCDREESVRDGSIDTSATLSSRRPSAESDSTQETQGDEYYDSQTSLESLSRSSSTCEPNDPLPPVTPSPLQPDTLSNPPAVPTIHMEQIAAMGSMPSDMIMVETPSMEDIYASSAPAKRSPEALFRFLTGTGSSPKSVTRRYSEEVPTPKGKNSHAKKGKGSMDYPLPPPIPQDEFSSLSKDVQLRSLHFDSLGLDFDGFSFPKGEAARA